uniref:Uncharacterized protein n=1 Tax=Anguilla anguilla TaxID=7936 RepID=A0A0E9SGR8_ANGAN
MKQAVFQSNASQCFLKYFPLFFIIPSEENVVSQTFSHIKVPNNNLNVLNN